jgi:ribosomal-protein-alanine N-acetyltransferase
MLGGIVRGKKVTLRTPKEDDLPFFDALMRDMRVRRGGQVWHEPAMPATWKERFKEAAKEESAVVWTIEADGAAVGLARVSWHSEAGHCDVHGLVIAPAHWGHGLGTDAAMTVHRYLFDYMDKRACAVEVPADNAAALRIAEKLGFVEFGRGHDVYYRDGRYVDKVFLRFDRQTWNERWAATEREYEPLAEGLER